LLEGLVADIRGHSGFHADYQSLVTLRLEQTLARSGASREPEGDAITRLIQSAGLLSLSADPRARREAFTIATAAFELYGEALGGLADALKLVMSRLGNFPSLDLRPELHGHPSQLPTPALLETTGRRVHNTVETAAGKLSLTDYQRTIWADLEEKRSVISSAPTSAGKSFMFQLHVAEMVGSGAIQTAAFIVPTRALISQVSTAFSALLERFPDTTARVLTVPVAQALDVGTSIFVMTQERLQVLLLDPNFMVEVIVIDEAHLIGDGDRGIILQSVVDELLARNPSTQLLFTLPRVKNPLELARVFRVAKPVVRKTDDSPVGQNIILADVSESVPDEVRARLWDQVPQAEVVTFDVAMELVHPDQKLVYLAWFFGRGSQSIIYGDSRSRCERLALLLGDVIQSAEDQTTASEAHATRRDELAKFIRDHVHPEFVLAKTVLHGVGFHYGHIPTLVRRAIEVAFEERALDFIVCTSTLLQGVNLPARNIFMRRPEKGEEPLEPVDFWNLAGRAGRLGQEFEGNVFLVDYAEWENQPLAYGPEGEVHSTMQDQLVTNTDALVAYIADANVESGRDTVLENIFSRLFRDYRVGKLSETLERLQVPAAKQVELVEQIERTARAVLVPTETLLASPYISPHRQQRLYTKLLRDLPKKGVDYYMPPHPAGEWKTVQSRLINVYRRLQVEFDADSKSQAYKRWATLSLSWMRGEGLPDLIQYEIDRDAERVARGRAAGGRERLSNTATIIRKILQDVERELRFKFVKQMGCYNAVLRQVLVETGDERSAKHIPAIPLFLEVGASSVTMLSFIDLGLSRISARLLQQRAANYAMDRDTALAWIKRQQFGGSLPDIVVRELTPLMR
jgi:hypothetical protein